MGEMIPSVTRQASHQVSQLSVSRPVRVVPFGLPVNTHIGSIGRLRGDHKFISKHSHDQNLFPGLSFLPARGARDPLLVVGLNEN